jgi:restriction endonuclease S subunit
MSGSTTKKKVNMKKKNIAVQAEPMIEIVAENSIAEAVATIQVQPIIETVVENSIAEAVATIQVQPIIETVVENSIAAAAAAVSVTTPVPALVAESSNLMQISNREALRDKIHEIHNFLRNNGAGYGMNALKIFNLLYGLMKIEDMGYIERSGLNDSCRFSHLLQRAQENPEKLVDGLIGPVLDAIKMSPLNNFLFYEIPRNMKASVYAELMNIMKELSTIETTYKVQLSGKIYEYFVGRDESAISEMGAYFTDRHIVNYVLEQANPRQNADGTIPTMIDMFGGSGGFTTGYIQYIKDHAEQPIDWTNELYKVHHYDMNIDVIKSAALEFLCMTGVVPNVETGEGHVNEKYRFNMRNVNSFQDHFYDQKFDYIITNPPYGGDKNKATNTQQKCEKIIKFIEEEIREHIDEGDIKLNKKKQIIFLEGIEEETRNKLQRRMQQMEKMQSLIREEENKNTGVCRMNSSLRINKFAMANGKLVANDKESVSLILMMDLLNEGGTAVGVLKEGVFFNKNYANIREVLIRNFNIRKVISVPSDQFENTTTKTSIVIFDNTPEKTSRIEFYNLVVDRYPEDRIEEIDGELVLMENKDDISGVHEELITYATMEELLANPNFSLFGKDYEKKEQEQTQVNSEYDVVHLEDICTFHKKSKRDIIESKDEGKYHFYSSSDKYKWIDEADYTQESMIMGTGGNSCIHIDSNFSCSTNTVVFSSKNKKISNSYIYYMLKVIWQRILYMMKGSVIKFISKKTIGKLEIPIPKNQELLLQFNQSMELLLARKKENENKILHQTKFIKDRLNEIIENENHHLVNLETLCLEIKSGKLVSKKNQIGTLYPFYAANGISGYMDEYLYDGKYIICSRDGTIGATYLVNTKFYPGHHVWVVKTDYIEYIYYILKYNVDYKSISTGSVIPNMTKERFMNIQIPIFENIDIQEEFTTHHEQYEQLVTEHKEIQAEFDEFIQQLNQQIFSI